MSTVTREFTKEQLIARINQVTAINKYRISRDPEADGLAMDNELLAIALASLEAEPVAWISERNLKNLGKSYSVYVKHEPVMVRPIPLYSAPPAPASVPDEITFEKIAEITASQGYEYSINECICAASWWNACRAAMLQGADGNSPVIPDGWVMVPVDATRAMIDAAARAEEDGYDAMHKAMIAAAPQQEVKNG